MGRKSNDDINDLFLETDDPGLDNTDELEPILNIDLEEVNEEAQSMAHLITERLSNYYFDEEYIKKHPYVPTKIMTEMNNIRRLLKMLAVNEKAQDSLITSITINAGKGALYMSLTSLQNSMLNIQKQLNDLTASLEEIFRQMQEECDKSFADKNKDPENADGTLTVRGSREFIKELNARLYGKASKLNTETEVEATDDAEAEEEFDPIAQ